jgi:hypothetical protein
MNQALRAWTAIAAVASGCAALSLSGAPPAAAGTGKSAGLHVTVVASGLNDPKNLTFGPGGLYITESGTGGSSCVSVSGTSYCEGETGAVDLLGRSGLHTVLSGLPSVVNSSEGTLGPSAVAFAHSQLAVLYQNTAVNPDGTTAVTGPRADLFGKLALSSPRFPSLWRVAADLTAFASAHPQDPATLGGPPGQETTYDSDPYDVVPYRGGYAIADAAANDVLWLSPAGHLSVIARLPTVPETVPAGTFGPDPVQINSQAVPTSLAVSPDGALYVGTLPGFPALAGTATVYRIRPGHAPAAAVTGLTEVSGLAFDKGHLLILEFNTGGGLAPSTVPGALLLAGENGTASALPVSGLGEPTGLTVGPDGAAYIAVNGNAAAGAGEVVKVTGLP